MAPLTLTQQLVDDRDVSGLWVWSAGEALAQWLCSEEAECNFKIGEVHAALEVSQR